MILDIHTQYLIVAINAITDFSAFEDNKITTVQKKKIRYVIIDISHPFFQSHSNQTNATAISRR